MFYVYFENDFLVYLFIIQTLFVQIMVTEIRVLREGYYFFDLLGGEYPKLGRRVMGRMGE